MTIKRPDTLLRGEALREAAATDFRDITELLRNALREYYKQAYPNREIWFPLEAVSADAVIIRMESDSRYYRHAYALDDNNRVTLGPSVEVTKEFQPVGAVPPLPPVSATGNSGSVFVEAKNAQGTLWEIRVIDAGRSLNNVEYPPTVLRESVNLFANARVYAKSDDEHVAGKGKDINKLIGRLVNPRFIEAVGDVPAGINADFELLATAGDIPAKLLEAWQRDMTSIFGFSIDADGKSNKKTGFREATKITKVHSVDLIIEPGAGGKVIRLIEAVKPKEEDTMRQRMIEAVKAANSGQLPAGLDVDDDTALEAAYREALGKQQTDGMEERIRMVEARASARITIATSTLPQAAKDKLLAAFAARDRFTEADVTAAISAERDYLARLTESGKPTGGDFNNGRVTEDRADRVATMLDDFFVGRNGVHSFKECYIDITGDKRVTGQLQHCDRARLREALGADAEFREAVTTTGFANVLGASLNRRMIADYNTPVNYDVWRNLTGQPVPLNDFKTQERVRYGGYGGLPAVAQNGNYAALTSPTDEKASYAPTKRGGVESITLESVKGDDVGLIRSVPVKMSRAAKRTLGKFVLDFLRTNPNIYDGVPLFHVSHGNLGTTTLSEAAYAAARLAMLKQVEKDFGDPLGIAPKYLWVPPDLEETATDLFKLGTNNEASFRQTVAPTVVSVWYWTDAADWCLTADPMETPVIEIGFLDGQEEPEMFVQDMPNVGSLFSNDAITYKIRHIYGGAVVDYRGAYKAFVA